MTIHVSRIGNWQRDRRTINIVQRNFTNMELMSLILLLIMMRFKNVGQATNINLGSIKTTVIVSNAKIINLSSGNYLREATSVEVREAGEIMAKEISETWTGSDEQGGRTVSTEVRFEGEIHVINNPREASSSDFLMVITNDGNRPGVIGEAPVGGNRISVDFSYSYLRDIIDRNDSGSHKPILLNPFGNNSRVPSHEYGHTGNLRNNNHGNGIMSIDMNKPSFKER